LRWFAGWATTRLGLLAGQQQGQDICHLWGQGELLREPAAVLFKKVHTSSFGGAREVRQLRMKYPLQFSAGSTQANDVELTPANLDPHPAQQLTAAEREYLYEGVS
jgi:hypothetical protein